MTGALPYSAELGVAGVVNDIAPRKDSRVSVAVTVEFYRRR